MANKKKQNKQRVEKFGAKQQTALYAITEGALLVPELVRVIRMFADAKGKKARAAARAAAEKLGVPSAEEFDARDVERALWERVADLQPFYSKEAQEKLDAGLVAFVLEPLADALAAAAGDDA